MLTEVCIGGGGGRGSASVSFRMSRQENQVHFSWLDGRADALVREGVSESEAFCEGFEKNLKSMWVRACGREDNASPWFNESQMEFIMAGTSLKTLGENRHIMSNNLPPVSDDARDRVGDHLPGLIAFQCRSEVPDVEKNLSRPIDIRWQFYNFVPEVRLLESGHIYFQWDAVFSSGLLTQQQIKLYMNDIYMMFFRLYKAGNLGMMPVDPGRLVEYVARLEWDDKKRKRELMSNLHKMSCGTLPLE